MKLLHIFRALGLSATIKQKNHNKTTKNVCNVRRLRFLTLKIDMHRIFVMLGHLQWKKSRGMIGVNSRDGESGEERRKNAVSSAATVTEQWSEILLSICN